MGVLGTGFVSGTVLTPIKEHAPVDLGKPIFGVLGYATLSSLEVRFSGPSI